jgi:hypothetical protein
MTERDQIFIILVVACFAGTSFWPVVMGWVDLGSFDGWLELVANFGSCALTVLVFSVGGIAGYFLLDLFGWCFRALVNVHSDEREGLKRGVNTVLRTAYLLADTVWKLLWKLAWSRSASRQ